MAMLCFGEEKLLLMSHKSQGHKQKQPFPGQVSSQAWQWVNLFVTLEIIIKPQKEWIVRINQVFRARY